MIQINKQQAEVLLRYMIGAALAVTEDRREALKDPELRKPANFYKGHFLTRAEDFSHELNELSE